ncbi:MAG: acyltransferase [Proteobacteria bacterium]|nr:acyltransferase [Pseudomonadota bacterium]
MNDTSHQPANPLHPPLADEPPAATHQADELPAVPPQADELPAATHQADELPAVPAPPQYYKSIDIAKFIAATTVVGIHTEIFCQFHLLDMGFGVISRLAVPLFFLISGFFFFSKPAPLRRVLHVVKRLLILYVIYSAFFTVLRLIINDPLSIDDLYIFLFRGGFRHLWFLIALIIGIILTASLQNFIKKWAVLATAAVFYILGLLLGTYYPIASSFPPVAALHEFLHIDYFTVRNGFFFGFPFVAAGMALAQLKQMISFKLSLALTLLSLGMLFAETWLAVKLLHTSSTILWLSSVPATFFMMQCLLQIKAVRFDTRFIRKTSTFIYLIHPTFILLLEPAMPRGLLMFAITFAFSLILAVLVAKGSEYKRFKFLTYLT